MVKKEFSTSGHGQSWLVISSIQSIFVNTHTARALEEDSTSATMTPRNCSDLGNASLPSQGCAEPKPELLMFSSVKKIACYSIIYGFISLIALVGRLKTLFSILKRNGQTFFYYYIYNNTELVTSFPSGIQCPLMRYFFLV